MRATQKSDSPGEAGLVAEAKEEYGGIVGAREGPCKAFATAQARAALGMALHRIVGDDGRAAYIATYHALTRRFSDLAEVEQWLEAVDGRRQEAAA